MLKAKSITKAIISLAMILSFAGTSIAKTYSKVSGEMKPNIIFIMTDDQSAIVPTAEDARFKFSDGNGKGVQSHALWI